MSRGSFQAVPDISSDDDHEDGNHENVAPMQATSHRQTEPGEKKPLEHPPVATNILGTLPSSSRQK